MEPIDLFFKQILTPSGKEKTNVYAYMFLCDFFNFILLIFGFSAFGVSIFVCKQLFQFALALNNLLLCFSDTTRGWWCYNILFRKSSPHAFSINVTLTICTDSH